VTGFTNESEAMRKGADALDEATGQIKGHLGNLQQHVDHMLSKWSGNAARSFGGAHGQFAEQGQKLTSALANMHTALVQTTKTYQATEEQGSSHFNNIAGQL